MFYKSDFVIPHQKIYIVNRNAFTITLNNNKKTKDDIYSIANAIKPLLYFSSIFSMNSIIYINGKINIIGAFNKIYSLILILLYSISVLFLKLIPRQQITDLPLTILDITSTISHFIEIIYDIIIISFRNSIFYVNLTKTIDDVDCHLSNNKSLFTKRRNLSIIISIIPCVIVFIAILYKNAQPLDILVYVTFLLVMVQGINCIFFLLVIYAQLLHFNIILLSKVKSMSVAKRLVFKHSVTARIVRKLLNNSVNKSSHYCWFELMQIYDKICDCIYLFNNIYDQQILLMFNSWLLSTILAICKAISPKLKNSDAFKTEIFYYIFFNLRPLFITKISEAIIQERKKALLILQHILIYQQLDENYQSQIHTIVKLVETRAMRISAKVCCINLKLMCTFAGRMISFTVLMVQLFYLHD